MSSKLSKVANSNLTEEDYTKSKVILFYQYFSPNNPPKYQQFCCVWGFRTIRHASFCFIIFIILCSWNTGQQIDQILPVQHIIQSRYRYLRTTEGRRLGRLKGKRKGNKIKEGNVRRDPRSSLHSYALRPFFLPFGCIVAQPRPFCVALEATTFQCVRTVRSTFLVVSSLFQYLSGRV